MSIIWSGLTEEGVIVPVQVTAEGKVVAVGDGPEGEYLKLTGGNLTGDLTVNEQITLATDGTATLSSIQSGDSSGRGRLLVDAPGNSAQRGRLILETNADCPNAAECFQVFQGVTEKSRISADGRATFAGGLTELNSNGSVQFGDITKYGMYVFDQCQMYVAGPSTAAYRVYCNETGGNETARISGNGSAFFANDKCGFTSNGEIYFMSRNTRYKIVVSNGICQAEEYPVARQIKEKAEQLIAEKRETKPSDPDPSDPQGEVTTDNDNAS